MVENQTKLKSEKAEFMTRNLDKNAVQELNLWSLLGRIYFGICLLCSTSSWRLSINLEDFRNMQSRVFLMNPPFISMISFSKFKNMFYLPGSFKSRNI
jgi:hypothetical protein